MVLKRGKLAFFDSRYCRAPRALEFMGGSQGCGQKKPRHGIAQGCRYSASLAALPEFMPVRIFRNPRVRFELKFEMTFFFSCVNLMMPPLFKTVVILRFVNFRAGLCLVFENPTFHVVVKMEPLAAHMDNALRQTDGFLFGYRPSDYPLTEEYFAFGELLMTLLLA